jgi:hypothetical protein
MIPRGTRSRPILSVGLKGKGIPIYINNIMSPGPFHVSTFLLQQESYRANAISCCLTYPKLEL